MRCSVRCYRVMGHIAGVIGVEHCCPIRCRLRRKRNTALYVDTGFVSHHDAEQALESADDYLNVIRADIVARKP